MKFIDLLHCTHSVSRLAYNFKAVVFGQIATDSRRAIGSSSTMRTRVFMRTPQWNGDDGLTASAVAPGKFQRRFVPVELFQA
jgi:hypothetical protein